MDTMKVNVRELKRHRGFTFLELMVVLGTLAILVGILVPSIARLRERERRTLCGENLRRLGIALSLYGKANRDELPRVIYDPKALPNGAGYVAFTGPDASDPFAAGGPVSPNDVTASLWLLVRGGYVSSDYTPITSAFICPSSGNEPDRMCDAAGMPVGVRQRSNFRSPSNLSYSYAVPFGNAPGYGLKADFIGKDFVLMADKNPGAKGPSQNAAGPAYDAPPLEMAIGNSRNHLGAGQNVLFGDMHVEFRETPYCGVQGDNIYTAMNLVPLLAGELPPHSPKGVLGKDVGPASVGDSYLVPTDSD